MRMWGVIGGHYVLYNTFYIGPSILKRLINSDSKYLHPILAWELTSDQANRVGLHLLQINLGKSIFSLEYSKCEFIWLSIQQFKLHFQFMFKTKELEEKKVKNATVINEQILLKAVKDYLNENKIIPKESINFSKIKVLSLSFLNIWKIQYLDSLVRLEKLQLDNNVIEKIENLGHLVNMKWLDLSFNNIKKIEGLDNLVNLTDLSLYNNHISVLDGLLSCSKLNIFSIGNNQIKSFEEIIAYFGRVGDKKTRFKYLQVLNVYGNPFTIKQNQKDQEYESYLVTHLPNLRYLDYIFIDEKRRKQIRQSDEKFKTEDQSKFIQQLKAQENKQRDEEQEKKKKENAKMHLLDGFAEQIVNIDDLNKIQDMEGLREETQKFTAKVKQLIESLQKRIKEQNEKKIVALGKLEARLYKRQADAEKLSLKVINEFEVEYKNSSRIIENRERGWKEEKKKVELQQIPKLRQRLMSIEIELMEDSENPFKKQLLQTFDDENRKLNAILSEEQKDDKGQQIGFFNKISEEIREFGVKLDKIAKQQGEAYSQLEASGAQIQQKYNDDLINILSNKDSIPNVISGIKEGLNQRKTKKEGQIENELCTKEKQAYKRRFEQRQYERNRNNIRNIKKKIDQLKKQINALAEANEDD